MHVRFENWRISLGWFAQISPSVSWGIFVHVLCLDPQEQKYLMDHKKLYTVVRKQQSDIRHMQRYQFWLPACQPQALHLKKNTRQMTAVQGNMWKMIEIFIEILIKKTEHFPNTKLIQVQVSCWLPFCFELNQKSYILLKQCELMAWVVGCLLLVKENLILTA